jgi:hypothetical protein
MDDAAVIVFAGYVGRDGDGHDSRRKPAPASDPAPRNGRVRCG